MEKKNILLVDDDFIANFLIEKVIVATGLARNVYKALNGEEALKIFNRHLKTDNEINAIPEIILLDLNMPIMNGFEFLQAFQNLQFEQKNNILIIMVTSSSNPSDIEKAKSLGIKHYLTKPISADTVRSIIMEAFN
jgi:CheY-like chemotaxis protein